MIPAVADPATLDGRARTPLLPETDPRGRAAPAGAGKKRPPPPATTTVLPAVVSAVLLLVLVAVTVLASQHVDDGQGGGGVAVVPAGGGGHAVVEVATSRGVADGVSEKSTAPLLGAAGAVEDFSWTNVMLAWQRTASAGPEFSQTWSETGKQGLST